MLIRFVVSGGTIGVRPSSPMLAYRTPFGLVILTDSGAAPNPGTGTITIWRIVRLPRQLSLSTGLPAPATQDPWRRPVMNKFTGARSGNEPQVELAVTSSSCARFGVSSASSESSFWPGTAIALAASRNVATPGVTNCLASGG